MRTLLIVLYTCLAIFVGYDSLTAKEYTYRNEAVYVAAGDTMWDIAGEYRCVDEDIREVVERICEVNNLPKGNLYAGQIIQVPIRVEVNSEGNYKMANKN